ncbi:uncharacterized protein DFR95_003372 [Clostridium beijerinckii]|nr:uncharacterized protein [Clostridium beijerinckii]
MIEKLIHKSLNSLLSFLLLVVSSIFLLSASAEIKVPSPTSYKYLNDYVHIASETEVNGILSIGKELEDKTGAQAVVVIINSTNNVPIEDYANTLFRSWGIGEKGKDNGLLVLLALNDRAWRVEVGRGLEGAIPDVLSSRIMESVAKPSFIEGKYGEGLLNSYSTFCDHIAKEYNVTLDKSLNISEKNTNTIKSNTGTKVFGSIALGLLLLDIIFNKGRISFFTTSDYFLE